MNAKQMMSIESAVLTATGVTISPSTAARWIKTPGIKGCVLKSWLLGNKRVTDVDSVLEFMEARSVSVGGSRDE